MLRGRIAKANFPLGRLERCECVYVCVWFLAVCVGVFLKVDRSFITAKSTRVWPSSILFVHELRACLCASSPNELRLSNSQILACNAHKVASSTNFLLTKYVYAIYIAMMVYDYVPYGLIYSDLFVTVFTVVVLIVGYSFCQFRKVLKM